MDEFILNEATAAVLLIAFAWMGLWVLSKFGGEDE